MVSRLRSRAADTGSNSALPVGVSPGGVIPGTYKSVHPIPLCQAPGFVGSVQGLVGPASVQGLVGPASVYCNGLRKHVGICDSCLSVAARAIV